MLVLLLEIIFEKNMEINIEFEKEEINAILKKNGYIIEEATFYYPRHPYSEEDAIRWGEICSVKTTVAYLKGIDCEWKHEEKPLLSNYKEFLYLNVVNKVISSLMYQKLL